MKDTIEIELSLEHINEELTSISCVVEVDIYQGSTEGYTSDDPSEIDILSVKLKNPNECPAIGENEIGVNPEIEKQIFAHYE